MVFNTTPQRYELHPRPDVTVGGRDASWVTTSGGCYRTTLFIQVTSRPDSKLAGP